MKYEAREVNDAELEAVAGGMTCDAAVVLSRIYGAAANVLMGLGHPAMAAALAGQGIGVLQGAGCIGPR
jgi:hypothetical protein